MKKQILNEEFRRMQLLAGVITEGEYKKELKENTAHGFDLDLLKDLQNDPATKKLRQQFVSNPQLALKAAKFVADYVDGKIDLSALDTSQTIKELTSVGSRRDESVQYLSQLKDPVRSDAYWKKIKDNEKSRKAYANAEEKRMDKIAADLKAKSKTTTKDKIKQVLNSAGLGILTTTLIGLIMAFGGAETLDSILLPSILVGSLMGVGYGALATDGFTRKDVVTNENVQSPEEELEQIIAIGRKA
jgi:hypothetical protein